MKDNNDPDPEIKYNNETTTKATSLFKACHNFEFIATLVISRNILSYTSTVTEMLLKKTNDILCAYQLIDTIKTNLLILGQILINFIMKYINLQMTSQHK